MIWFVWRQLSDLCPSQLWALPASAWEQHHSQQQAASRSAWGHHADFGARPKHSKRFNSAVSAIVPDSVPAAELTGQLTTEIFGNGVQVPIGFAEAKAAIASATQARC